MWQQSDDGVLRNWDNANTYCQNLTLGGFYDWRLPTKDELKGLVVCSNGTPTPLKDYPNYPDECGDNDNPFYDIPTIDPSIECKNDNYWSSTKNDTDNKTNKKSRRIVHQSAFFIVAQIIYLSEISLT
ncbi:MAG: DUF1566 domain-containing protein [Desulfocapsa sp.]|nr:DUF1566 domain-containing protein [Desulfocapsa sp.]